MTHRAVQTLPHPRPVGTVVYLDTDTIATVADEGFIRIWHLRGPEITEALDTIFALS